MRTLTPLCHWAFAILFCLSLIFNGCKKADTPEVKPEPEDVRITNVRNWAYKYSKVENVKDPAYTPVTMEYATYTLKDQSGKIIAQFDGNKLFTKEKTDTLSKIIPELLVLKESTTPVTLQIMHRYERFGPGDVYTRAIMLSVDPPIGSDKDKYTAFIDVSEVIIEPLGSQSYLWKAPLKVFKEKKQ